jgi:hypothetical protein
MVALPSLAPSPTPHAASSGAKIAEWVRYAESERLPTAATATTGALRRVPARMSGRPQVERGVGHRDQQQHQPAGKIGREHSFLGQHRAPRQRR